jgi:hypothetical protein
VGPWLPVLLLKVTTLSQHASAVPQLCNRFSFLSSTSSLHACAQTSRGSKRSAEALAFERGVQGGQADEDEAAKRAKTGSGRLLSEEEKLERRCAHTVPSSMLIVVPALSLPACCNRSPQLSCLP